MDILSVIVVYTMMWWITLFMVLPFGAHREHDPKAGHDHGAPKKSYLKIKLLVTTLITTLLFVLGRYLIHIDFRSMGG